MALLDDLFSMLSKVPVGGGGGTVAQDRFTHTPVVYEPTRDSSWAGSTNMETPWWQRALGQGVPLGGMPASQKGVIEIQPNVPGGSFPDTLRHEIVHAATVDALDPKGTLYKQALRALPQQVRDEVPGMWSKVNMGGDGPDIVHEGVARFLTSPDYFDPKWNDQKSKLVGLFPTATRGKLTRILGNQGVQMPQVGQMAPDFSLGGK